MKPDYRKLNRCGPRSDSGSKPHAGMGDKQTVMPGDGLPPIGGSDRYHENDGRILALFPTNLDQSGNPAPTVAVPWGGTVNGYSRVSIAGRRIKWTRDDSGATGAAVYFRLRKNQREQTD